MKSRLYCLCLWETFRLELLFYLKGRKISVWEKSSNEEHEMVSKYDWLQVKLKMHKHVYRHMRMYIRWYMWYYWKQKRHKNEKRLPILGNLLMGTKEKTQYEKRLRFRKTFLFEMEYIYIHIYIYIYIANSKLNAFIRLKRTSPRLLYFDWFDYVSS